jgi:hypothetical protein
MFVTLFCSSQIDKEALDSQVNERKKKEQAEAESLKAYGKCNKIQNGSPDSSI